MQTNSFHRDSIFHTINNAGHYFIFVWLKRFSNKRLHAQDVMHFRFLTYAMFCFYLLGALYQPLFIILLSRVVSCNLHFWFSATNNRTRHGSDVLMSDHGKVRASRRLISGSHEPWAIFVRATRAAHYKANRHSSLSTSRGYV